MKKLYKNWFVHNMLGHPLMQIFNMLGFRLIASYIHDCTLPEFIVRNIDEAIELKEELQNEN